MSAPRLGTAGTPVPTRIGRVPRSRWHRRVIEREFSREPARPEQAPAEHGPMDRRTGRTRSGPAEGR